MRQGRLQVQHAPRRLVAGRSRSGRLGPEAAEEAALHEARPGADAAVGVRRARAHGGGGAASSRTRRGGAADGDPQRRGPGPVRPRRPRERDGLRRASSGAGRETAVLFLGRLAANKGLELLARSFAVVRERGEDAALLVAGPNEGDTRLRVQRLLEEAGLLDCAIFTGSLVGQDKLAALACADVFVLPSRAEGFSNAVLEAMAAGLPVVVSEQCNFPEVSAFGAGRVVRNDVAEVADAICDYLGDEGKRRTAGANARRLVEERNSWPRVAAAFADIYQSITRST